MKKNLKKKSLKKTNPKLYRAKALRLAYRKLGHNLSVEEVLALMDNDICPYCNKQISPLDFSIDHKLPLSLTKPMLAPFLSLK